MVNYDSKIIQEFADRLYKKANSIIISYTLVGILVGFVPTLLLMRNEGTEATTALIIAGIVAALFGLIGFVIGRERVFRLKLQAQTALCQLKIEQNTNKKIA